MNWPASDLFSYSFYQLPLAVLYIPVLLTLREALFLSVPGIVLMCLQKAIHFHNHHCPTYLSILLDLVVQFR